MANGTRTIEISPQAFELASRGAALDRIDVGRYIEFLVMRDADYIRTREFLDGASPTRPSEGRTGSPRLAA